MLIYYGHSITQQNLRVERDIYTAWCSANTTDDVVSPNCNLNGIKI